MIAPTLNELSLVPASQPMNERAESLLQVIRGLDALGFPRMLRQVRGAIDREIASGLSLRRWLFQHAPRDLRLFVAGRLEKPPYVEELHENVESQKGALLQAHCDGQSAVGAGLAHFHEVPCVALCGVAQWERDPLPLTISELTDGEAGRLVEQQVEVVNLSSAAQLQVRAPVLRTRVLCAVQSGADLWARRQQLLPRLDFCASVERQVSELSGNELFFYQIVLALSRLNAALESWQDRPLHPGMDFSTESASTLNHRTYGPMRDFDCPDQVVRRFSLHLKIKSANWRIYYIENRTSDMQGRAYIGYIGTHLSTVLYRT